MNYITWLHNEIAKLPKPQQTSFKRERLKHIRANRVLNLDCKLILSNALIRK